MKTIIVSEKTGKEFEVIDKFVGHSNKSQVIINETPKGGSFFVNDQDGEVKFVGAFYMGGKTVELHGKVKKMSKEFEAWVNDEISAQKKRKSEKHNAIISQSER